MFDRIIDMTPEQGVFVRSVCSAMVRYFGNDQRRIDHALQVSRYAQDLLAFIDADPVVTLSSAYLHDIGIHEAERKHGSNAGALQEIEGPPVAEAILAGLGADSSLTEAVLWIVGHHHTRTSINSPEFRIIWDADALVNFADVLPGKTDVHIKGVLQRHMVTEAGYRLASQIFMQDTESHKQCLAGHRPAFLP